MRKIIASQKGATIVEFAIVLIPLLLITFGIIEFGIMRYDQHILTNACREGARAGIVATAYLTPRLPSNPATACSTNGSSQPTIECVVKYYCQNNLVTFGTYPNLQITTTVSGPTGHTTTGTATFGDTLTVTTSYNYSFLYLSNFIGTKTLTSVARMAYE